jgi:DNA repair exonuclease SbcCD ATPase subunit
MKYLTFLDYPTLEATGRSFQSQLKGVVEQKDKEIAELKLKVLELSQGTDEIKELKQKAKEYDSFWSSIKPQIEKFQQEIKSLRELTAEKNQLQQLRDQIDALHKKEGL